MNIEMFSDDLNNYINEFESDLLSQSEKLSDIYSDFSMEDECKNKDFLNLLTCGISLKSAYEALHNDKLNDLINSNSEKKVSERIRANLMRPLENAVASVNGISARSGTANFTKNERAEIAKRVLKGEKITF